MEIGVLLVLLCNIKHDIRAELYKEKSILFSVQNLLT